MPRSAAAAAVEAETAEGTRSLSIFHLVVLASQRAKQLAAGARPRVDPGIHRHPRVALLEVSAGLISWSVTEKPAAIDIESAHPKD